MLEDAGVVRTEPKEGRRGRTYGLTEAGRALWDVVGPMAAWGERWIELQPEHTDPSFVLWAWVHAHLRRDLLPDRRVVVEFEFPDQSPPHHRMWLLFDGDDTELCHAPPGFDVDVEVVARSEAFTSWHVGRVEWSQAVRSGDIRVRGPRRLARALPTWNERALTA